MRRRLPVPQVVGGFARPRLAPATWRTVTGAHRVILLDLWSREQSPFFYDDDGDYDDGDDDDDDDGDDNAGGCILYTSDAADE